MAARRGDRSPHRCGLRARAQASVRHVVSECAEDRARSGQSQHPQTRLTYEAFPAAEARRLAERFEWHYTPKHGSWLNMAETELSVLSAQCLDRRIPDKAMLTEEAAAWTAQRNKKHAKADWQFTTADARVKLKRLYPSI